MGNLVSAVRADTAASRAEATTPAHASSLSGWTLSSPFSSASSHSLSSRWHRLHLLTRFLTPHPD
jgi:hypothetical protein